MDTFQEFQAAAASEKVALVILEASKRVVGWSLHSGSVYKLEDFEHHVIVSIEDSGVALTSAASTTLAAGQFYLDRDASILYLRTSDSVNPNSKFIACQFRNYFSNVAVNAPNDLSTGFSVEWRPMLLQTSEFGVEVDNKNLVGFAIEGSGRVVLVNDQGYWKPRFDKWTFENQRCFIYSWNRDLPITEAKLIYRGRVQTKAYDTKKISFSLKDLINELRAPVPLTDLVEYPSVLIPPNLETAKQRLMYGLVKGNRPTNIDQVLPLTGYLLTGTASVTNGSTIVTGTGTSFLAQFSPGDELRLSDDEDKWAVGTVDSDSQITLTEEYEGQTGSGKTIYIFPGHAKRYLNRILLVAGHALREPTATIVNAMSTTLFTVDDATDIEAGGSIFLNGQMSLISRVSGNTIKLVTGPSSIPTVGNSITRLSIANVYLNNRLLQYSRDYVYSASLAKITIDPLAEFNVAPVRSITGTVGFVSTSRLVSGTGTFFKKEVSPGDWIKRNNQSAWYEVLSIESDTALTLRTASAYTSSGAADQKIPEVHDGDSVVLSCDVLGATDDGTPTGVFLKTASQIVSDLLDRAGLGDMIDTDAFDEAEDMSAHQIGVPIPERFDDTKPPSLRDVINKINQSVLGSLYQNEDFEFGYSILSPKRETTDVLRLRESDVLNFKVESDSTRITKTTRIRHTLKEFDPASLDRQLSEVVKTSDQAQYLAKSTKEQIIETYLTDTDDAQYLCNRWEFLLAQASAVVTIDTKLQAARVAVHDRVELQHEKIYERIGSAINRKVSGVQASRKSSSNANLELDDLSNAFSRCAVITEDDAEDFDAADDEEKMYNGYITDDYGMQDNNPDSFGSNLIW